MGDRMGYMLSEVWLINVFPVNYFIMGCQFFTENKIRKMFIKSVEQFQWESVMPINHFGKIYSVIRKSYVQCKHLSIIFIINSVSLAK